MTGFWSLLCMASAWSSGSWSSGLGNRVKRSSYDAHTNSEESHSENTINLTHEDSPVDQYALGKSLVDTDRASQPTEDINTKAVWDSMARKDREDGWNDLMLTSVEGMIDLFRGGWPPSGEDLFQVGVSIVGGALNMVHPILGAAFTMIAGLFGFGNSQANMLQDLSNKILKEASRIMDGKLLQYNQERLTGEFRDTMDVLGDGPDPYIYKTSDQKTAWWTREGNDLRKQKSNAFQNCYSRACPDKWKSMTGGGTALVFELGFINTYLSVASVVGAGGSYQTANNMKADAKTMVSRLREHYNTFSAWRKDRSAFASPSTVARGMRGQVKAWQTAAGKDRRSGSHFCTAAWRANWCKSIVGCKRASDSYKNRCVTSAIQLVQSELDTELNSQVSKWEEWKRNA